MRAERNAFISIIEGTREYGRGEEYAGEGDHSCPSLLSSVLSIPFSLRRAFGAFGISHFVELGSAPCGRYASSEVRLRRWCDDDAAKPGHPLAPLALGHPLRPPASLAITHFATTKGRSLALEVNHPLPAK